jgi:hypothetical protein
MSRAELLALVSLAVSVTSLSFSAYFGLRDRGRVRAESTIYPATEYTYPRISIAVVNNGRRPIVLRMLVGTSDKGTSVGKYLGKRNSGLRLAEHERVEVNLEAEDAIGMTAEEGSIVFTDLWVEDSLGRRYRVKNAREHLGVLLSSRSQSSLALNMDAH